MCGVRCEQTNVCAKCVFRKRTGVRSLKGAILFSNAMCAHASEQRVRAQNEAWLVRTGEV